MTGGEIVTCAEAMDDAARARINAAMDQARWFASQTCIPFEMRPGMIAIRTLTRAEAAAAVTAACELAVIADGGLKTLGRV